jgi:hypothetical protein
MVYQLLKMAGAPVCSTGGRHSLAIELEAWMLHCLRTYGGLRRMNKRELDGGFRTPPAQAPRRSARVSIKAQVKLRRRGSHNFLVHAFDFSPEGCKLEFLERPDLDEMVWVTFEGMEPIGASVCWIEGVFVGVEFARPIHRAVFDHLVSRNR